MAISDNHCSSEDTPMLRQWLLLKSLSVRRHGMTVREMSDETGVSQKTIRRDLQLFQQLGFPIEDSEGERGCKHWRIAATWWEPQVNFTFDEAIALFMARRLLQPLAGTPFWRAAQRAYQKIRASLSDRVVAYVDRMGERLHHVSTGAGDYAHKEELIDQLMIGIEDNRAVFITYQSQRATEPVTYDIYPYGITTYFGALYLIGHHTDAGEIRTWKVDRIEDAEATEVHFQRPTDFDLARFHDGSFGIYHGRDKFRIKIRFAPPVARYVQESRWHASQRLTPQSLPRRSPCSLANRRGWNTNTCDTGRCA
jgi:proteasome accessory factor B